VNGQAAPFSCTDAGDYLRFHPVVITDAGQDRFCADLPDASENYQDPAERRLLPDWVIDATDKAPAQNNHQDAHFRVSVSISAGFTRRPVQSSTRSSSNPSRTWERNNARAHSAVSN
jgi:hypothetical protein